MMRRSFLIALLALAITAVAGSSSALAAKAKDNYKFYCSQCHGLTGDGKGPNSNDTQPVSPRDHTDPVGMAKLPDADIINVIKGGGKATGKSSMMPPFSKTLTEKEITDLKDYLRKLCKCKGP
jgi:cytochrome c oxidase cbb3-type subunit 3